MSGRKRLKLKKGAKTVPVRHSWKTTDEYEIELRRKRMREEPMKVAPARPGEGVYQDYIVSRKDASHSAEYRVELRSTDSLTNTCDCPDFRKNFLGTCKHIEKVVSLIPKKTAKSSPFVEVFMGRSPYLPKISVPEGVGSQAQAFLRRYATPLGGFKAPEAATTQVFLRELDASDGALRKAIRVSAEVRAYARLQLEKGQLAKWREEYARKLHEDKGSASFLREALYDYQVEGMLHLAFNGRALLADEMGLGKTVQAIAAAGVLKECFGIKRVLVVTPASLKAEWEEQIRKFTALPAQLVYGAKARRLELYRHAAAVFTIVNYEQAVHDLDGINDFLQPDLVILDEAQRIKNWQTKTAACVKRLESRFAFVLTGTPLENKIDELYSIVEFIDPSLFGSLFRFNRKFYRFDADGKVAGCQNLRELHELLRPIMLRRRKDEIGEQLPERLDNNYFVPMSDEQKEHYAEHEETMTRLAAAAQHRPLSPEEFDRLQRALACMRMVCDSAYILDADAKEAPKIEELFKILDDLWDDDPERKVIIFSEWTRMLDLVKARLAKSKCQFALHTGQLDQVKRRAELNRFKGDASCRVLLSSDSGSVGLNLQAASVVVNLDLPWNPAKLEQRIARAWRKHQRHAVNVVNIITEDSIEHRMLGTLGFKKGLSDAVLDARGDFQDFEKANAKSAFLERLGKLMSSSMTVSAPEGKAAVPPRESLTQELALDNLGLRLCKARYNGASGALEAVFAVGDAKAASALAGKIEKTHGVRLSTDKISVVSPESYALLLKLAQTGAITINSNDMVKLFESDSVKTPLESLRERRLKLLRPLLATAERQLKMASVLKEGGFEAEALAPALKAVETAALALYVHALEEVPGDVPPRLSPEMLKTAAGLPGLDRRSSLLLQVYGQSPQNPALSVEDAKDFLAVAGRLALL